MLRKIFKKLKTRIRSYIKFLDDLSAYLKIMHQARKRKYVEFGVRGGLGDVIMGTQFVNLIKDKIPDCRIKIFHHDSNDKPNPLKMSFGSVRKYTSKDGTKIDPILEWFQNIYNIDEIESVNKTEFKRKLSFYPHAVGAFLKYKNPEFVNKYYFKKKFNDISFNLPASKVNLELLELKKNGYKIISVHLRRNINKIIELVKKIDEQQRNVHFIILGSTEHDPLPNLPDLKSSTSLVDSYKKNIGTLELLAIARNSDLYIGGRGGFECFFWLSEIPSINIFDDYGYFEKDCLMWPKMLWKNNEIKGPFSVHSPPNVLVDCFNKWLNK